MISIKVRLYQYRPSKDGLYPLVFQLIYQRKKKMFYTPYRLAEGSFCELEKRVTGPLPGDILPEEINAYIRKTREGLWQSWKTLQELGKEFTVVDVFDLYQSRRSDSYVILYMERQIKDRENAGHLGTVNSYLSTMRRILAFKEGKRDLMFDEINLQWLNRFRLYLQKTGITANTLNFYMRVFRTIYNRATKEGVVGTDPLSPFREISLTHEETVKRGIDQKDIRKISSVDLRAYPKMDEARDLFLFSFYCRGMSFVDISFLKKDDIKGNVLYYKRSKTGHPLQIKIEKPLAVLIKKYANKSEYILPILKPEKGLLYTQYKTALKRFNAQLKKLSDHLGLPMTLTTYVARHTWAMMAKQGGISISVISEALGHSSEEVTYSYLAKLDTVIDTANKQIINLSE